MPTTSQTAASSQGCSSVPAARFHTCPKEKTTASTTLAISPARAQSRRRR